MCVSACSWTDVANLSLSGRTTYTVQSFTRPNGTSTFCQLKGPLMSAFQEISVASLPSAQSHVAVELFKRNFWVIVMSSQRQQRCGCNRHSAQLSASTCRSRSWLYGVALPDDTRSPTPLLSTECPLFFYNEGGCYGTSTPGCTFLRYSMKEIHFSELFISLFVHGYQIGLLSRQLPLTKE